MSIASGFQVWKDGANGASNPSKAWDAGASVPGSSATDDFIFSHWAGSSWARKGKWSSAQLEVDTSLKVGTIAEDSSITSFLVEDQGVIKKRSSGGTGPTGPTGADGSDGSDGAAGATGPTGPAGADGSDGSDGAAGATGPTGPAGADGSNGSNGSNGTSINVTVSSSAPSGGSNGDVWFKT
ncbi:MAG: collagen-like protein [Bacteroidetes bacterium]|nr:collagen-like protein [Bacteroidota bacterium]